MAWSEIQFLVGLLHFFSVVRIGLFGGSVEVFFCNYMTEVNITGRARE